VPGGETSVNAQIIERRRVEYFGRFEVVSEVASKRFAMRPTRAAFFRAAGLRFVGFAGVIIVLAIQLYLSKGKLGATAVVLPALAVLTVFAAMWHVLYLANVRVEVGDERVMWADRFGRRRVRARTDIAGLAGRAVTWDGVPAPPTTVFVMYDKRHRAIAVFPAVYWDKPQMQALKDALGLAGQLHAKEVDVKVLDREFPGSVPFWQRHNWLTALVLVGVLGTLFFLLIGSH
jgi:hypothetical protein